MEFSFHLFVFIFQFLIVISQSLLCSYYWGSLLCDRPFIHSANLMLRSLFRYTNLFHCLLSLLIR
jgi:hypothetical protein